MIKQKKNEKKEKSLIIDYKDSEYMQNKHKQSWHHYDKNVIVDIPRDKHGKYSEGIQVEDNAQDETNNVVEVAKPRVPGSALQVEFTVAPLALDCVDERREPEEKHREKNDQAKERPVQVVAVLLLRLIEQFFLHLVLVLN